MCPIIFSQEMCEGRDYDEKSDVWAMGCVLGEMCSKQKTFSATNLSELVTKIMNVQFLPLPDGYSEQLKYLQKALLQKDPKDRPSAYEVLKFYIPLVYKSLGKLDGYNYIDLKLEDFNNSMNYPINKYSPTKREYFNASTATMNEYVISERSILYRLSSFANYTSLEPVPLPSTIKFQRIAASGSHFLVLTDGKKFIHFQNCLVFHTSHVFTEGDVYSWGDNSKGQLGQQNCESWKHFPTKIESLSTYKIIDCCAGNGFSLFVTTLGVVLSCGDINSGCLGHQNFSSSIQNISFQPKALGDDFHTD